MTHEDVQDGGYHCYFKKQPQTSEEIVRAVMACALCRAFRAVRYAGRNPKILKRFKQLDSRRVLRRARDR